MVVAESDLGSIESMLQHMEDAVIVTTADLEAPGPTIVFVNRSFSELTGYAPGEILGNTPRILQGSTKTTKHVSMLREDLRTRKHFYGEVVNRRKDGSEYAARCQIVPYLNGAGDVLYWINIQRDITPLVHERHSREVAETTYRNLVENQSDLICQFRPDTTLTFANAAYAKFVGRNPDDLTGDCFADFFAEKERCQILLHLETLTPEQPSKQYEGHFADKDGHAHWIVWRTSAFFDADGRLLRYQAAGTDITERKQAENLLLESEHRFRDFAAAASDWFWEMGSDLRFTWFSDNLYSAAGISGDRLIGKRREEIDKPDVDERLWAGHLDDLEKRRAFKDFQYRNCSDDGQPVHVRVSGVPVFDDSGKFRGYRGTVTNITAQVLAQEEAAKSKERLEDAIESITDGFALYDSNDRLVIFNKNYKKALKEISQFLVVGAQFGEITKKLAESGHVRIPEGRTESWVRQRLAEHGEPGTVREHQTRDGRWTEAREYQTRDGGTVIIRTDVTDRKRAEAALFDEKERAQVTLHSIGDAVITTNASGIVEYLNPVAEALTGWDTTAAKGLALEEVFRIIDEDTREPAPDPVTRCLREGKIVGLANHSVLIDRNGKEYAIEDTVAPIRGRDGGLLGAVLVFHDVSETRSMARQLAYDAAHDPLTGLINRREFEKRLQRAVLSAKQHGSRHMLCYMDLDQFKLINDTAGHSAGDELLKRVRGLLSGKFRERDTLGRLGGDEFGLLLNNCDPEEAQAICDVIVAAFRDYRFKWQGRTFQVGVSIGLVAVTADAASADQLLGQADVACYTAKELGRNQIHLYQMEGAKLSLRHSEIMLASGLQDALEQHRFCLYCQPIVELSAAYGQPTRYELLLRLLDKGEVLSPIAFIPAAERYGLMNTIDRWVIRKAFQSYKEIFSADSGVEIAINLSGNSLGDDSFLEFLVEQFSRFSMRPQSVCFEITETAAIMNLKKAADLLKEIKKAGSKLALDDFGAGLSSFTYLKSFPADYLKIDGSFVHDMADSSVDSAMVEAINQVGHTLGMTTIAECVQCDAVVDRLRALGVNWAQGNALGAPMPLDEIRGRVTIN